MFIGLELSKNFIFWFFFPRFYFINSYKSIFIDVKLSDNFTCVIYRFAVFRSHSKCYFNPILCSSLKRCDITSYWLTYFPIHKNSNQNTFVETMPLIFITYIIYYISIQLPKQSSLITCYDQFWWINTPSLKSFSKYKQKQIMIA